MSKISEYLKSRGFTFVGHRKGYDGREIRYRSPHGTIVNQRTALLYARQDEKAAKAATAVEICLDCDNSPCICPPEPDCDDSVFACPNCEQPQQFGGLCSTCMEEMRQTPTDPFWQQLAEAGQL